MNITSLLITLAGIIFIVALYIISRISQSKLPKDTASTLPNLIDKDGNRFSSVLDDIPARDGSIPTVDSVVENNPNDSTTTEETDKAPEVVSDEAEQVDQNIEQGKPVAEKPKQQHILFITGRDDKGLDGSLVQQALKKNGLVLADMDIYHYFPVMKDAFPESEKYSLFRIANGIAPWTLRPEDLVGKKVAGLSVVMLTPTKINDSEAISLFIALSEKICRQIGGILKNQEQQLFTDKDKKNLLSLYKN